LQAPNPPPAPPTRPHPPKRRAAGWVGSPLRVTLGQSGFRKPRPVVAVGALQQSDGFRWQTGQATEALAAPRPSPPRVRLVGHLLSASLAPARLGTVRRVPESRHRKLRLTPSEPPLQPEAAGPRWTGHCLPRQTELLPVQPHRQRSQAPLFGSPSLPRRSPTPRGFASALRHFSPAFLLCRLGCIWTALAAAFFGHEGALRSGFLHGSSTSGGYACLFL